MSGQKTFPAGNKSMMDEATKNIVNVINQYAELQAQRNKLQVGLLTNALEAKQNWIHKMKEMTAQKDLEWQNKQKELSFVSPFQKTLQEQYQNQNQPGTTDLSGDVLAQPLKQRVELGEKGFVVGKDNPKELIFGMIQKKEAAGYPLNKKEREIQDSYLGVSQAGTTSIPEGLSPLPRGADETTKQTFLSNFSPEKQEIIKGISDYTLDATKTSSLFRSNERQTMIGLAKMYNPDFDMKSFIAAQQYQNPNTKVGQNIVSLNTLVGHIRYLKSAIDNLKASGQPLENAVILTARNILGDPTITNYDQAKEVVDNELQRALTGVGVTQEGMVRQGAVLPRRRFGAQQADQYITALAHILDVRLGALETGYRQQIRQDPHDLIRYPETRDTLSNILTGTTGPTSEPKPSAPGEFQKGQTMIKNGVVYTYQGNDTWDYQRSN